MPTFIGCAASWNWKTSAGTRQLPRAIAIVEWPERIAAALPARRLEVRILFDPSHDPGWRILELRGFGQSRSGWRERSVSGRS